MSREPMHRTPIHRSLGPTPLHVLSVMTFEQLLDEYDLAPEAGLDEAGRRRYRALIGAIANYRFPSGEWDLHLLHQRLERQVRRGAGTVWPATPGRPGAAGDAASHA